MSVVRHDKYLRGRLGNTINFKLKQMDIVITFTRDDLPKQLKDKAIADIHLDCFIYHRDVTKRASLVKFEDQNDIKILKSRHV